MPKKLDWKQINMWSDFADKNYKQNMAFSDLWSQFEKENPNSGIDKDALQADLEAIRAKAQKMGESTGMEYITTGLSFPTLEYEGKNYGRMNAMGETEMGPKKPMSAPKNVVREVPSGVTEDKIAFDEVTNMWSWENPQTGDIEYGYENIEAKSPMIQKLAAARRAKVKKGAEYIK